MRALLPIFLVVASSANAATPKQVRVAARKLVNNREFREFSEPLLGKATRQPLWSKSVEHRKAFGMWLSALRSAKPSREGSKRSAPGDDDAPVLAPNARGVSHKARRRFEKLHALIRQDTPLGRAGKSCPCQDTREDRRDTPKPSRVAVADLRPIILRGDLSRLLRPRCRG